MEHLADRLLVRQAILCRGRRFGTHANRDCIIDCVEGVFVSAVVTDDERQGAIGLKPVLNPAHGCSLVPVNAGPDLDDHLPLGQYKERMIGGNQRLQDRLDLLARSIGGASIVNCRGQALAFDLHARQEQRAAR